MTNRDKDRKKTDGAEAQEANRAVPLKPEHQSAADDAVVRRSKHVFGNEPHRQVGGSRTQRDEG